MIPESITILLNVVILVGIFGLHVLHALYAASLEKRIRENLKKNQHTTNENYTTR